MKRKVNRLEKKLIIINNVTNLIHINQYNTDKQNLEKKIGDVDKKIPYASNFMTNTVFNIKISEVENKISNTSNLLSANVLNTKNSEVENTIPDNSKYITTWEFNKFTAEKSLARLKQASLVNKIDFDNKLTSFNRRITSNKVQVKYCKFKNKTKDFF